MQRRRKRRRRKRKINLLPIQIVSLFVLGCILVVVLLTGFGFENRVEVNSAPNNETKDTLDDDKEVSEYVKKYTLIMKDREQYPDKLINLLNNNSETVDFVYNYLEKKDEEPAESVGGVEEGEIPQLLQWDEKWGYAEYGDDIIAISGCGPTALSMVAVGLTGDDSITPYKVAKYATENSYYVQGTGTAWNLMTEGCQHFGVQGTELPLDKDVIFSALNEGNPIICSMGAGDFTDKGHFIVLAGVKDGKIQVNDPNSKNRTRLWEYETLESQIRNLWKFEKIEEMYELERQ